MNEEAAEKSFDPTPRKLEQARKKGEIARSVDLQTAAGYAGFTLVLVATGESVIRDAGTILMTLIAQSSDLAEMMFAGGAFSAPMGGILSEFARSIAPIFIVPAVLVLVTILAQRAFVVTPSKLVPKISRISIIKNAQNKFGRSGLFEFAKSFVKLTIYSICLGLFLNANMEDIVGVIQADAGIAVALLGELALVFLFVVVLVASVIGTIDAVWQHQEHIRKNRMTRKEIIDETKESEGDPYVKQERRNRAQTIATTQMISEVPNADVIVVNPTHYAVALKWSRAPGTAPECVAKGVDSLALKIRDVGQEHGVPIHSDPPTARALHASVEVGEEITPDFYQAVAAAIRFADAMRERAKTRI